MTMDSTGTPALETRDLSVRFGENVALERVSVEIPKNHIVAFIGPSGCGKSTLLRAFNRMNDLIRGATLDGSVFFNGVDLYADTVDPVEVRRRIGMVFQQPTPFPKSVFENVAFGPRVAKLTDDLEGVVEDALKASGLWDEVAERMTDSALELSAGQQQRLCIARTLAVKPDVLLMDEPTAALDPVATQRFEALVKQLKTRYTIVFVTHDLQQAARLSDLTGFLHGGELVEFGETKRLFTNPAVDRTEAYVTGRFT